MLTDTHTHLTMAEYKDIDEVLDRARTTGIEFMIDVGFDIASSEKSTELSQKHDHIYSAIGIHPHDAKSFDEECYRKIKELLVKPKVKALGEIGLDYHYNLSSQEEQKRMFAKLLWTAREMNLPVIFHNRESTHDMFDIVRSEGQGKVNGVFHSFAGSLDELKWILENGFYISISGMITFKKAQNIVDIAKAAPIDRILIETDCPYLTPEPYRGKRNEPSYVKYVAQSLAKVKGMTVDEVGEITTQNAKVLFRV